jgi:hypothetical protein
MDVIKFDQASYYAITNLTKAIQELTAQLEKLNVAKAKTEPGAKVPPKLAADW